MNWGIVADLNHFLEHLEGLMLAVRRSCEVLARSAAASANVIAEVNAGVAKGFGQVDLVATYYRDGLDGCRDRTQRDPDLAGDPAGHHGPGRVTKRWIRPSMPSSRSRVP